MDKVSLVPEKVNQIAATAVCETACQGTKLITEATGLNISGRGLGKSQVELVHQHGWLAIIHKGAAILAA